MRKGIGIILTIVILTTVLSGCIVIDRTYPLLYSSDQVDRIEIYFLETSVKHDIPESAVPVSYISPEDYEAFCAELQKLPFQQGILLLPVAIDLGFYLDGYVVKVIYNTGGYDIIDNDGYQHQQELDESNYRSRSFSMDDTIWISFIEKYINREP